MHAANPRTTTCGITRRDRASDRTCDCLRDLHEIIEEHCCGGALKITTVGHSNGRR